LSYCKFVRIFFKFGQQSLGICFIDLHAKLIEMIRNDESRWGYCSGAQLVTSIPEAAKKVLAPSRYAIMTGPHD